MTAAEALERLETWPRLPLATLPTPLRPAGRLAKVLDVPELLVKMDAETGFALGGNKVRKLEFELGSSRLDGVTCLLTAGGPQSNHCRVTAAAAARHGIRCILVLNGPEPDPPTGNALLHRLFGAEIHTVADRAARSSTMDDVAERLREGGGRPLVVPIGASTGLGSLGYARAAVELAAQFDALGPRPKRSVVFVPSSSCGTLAGLVLGFSLLGRIDICLVGISADATAEEIREGTLAIARDGATLLGWDGEISGTRLGAVDDQVGEGYGIPTEASREATEIFGRTEGLVLDPTYTSKAAAGMIDWIRSGRREAGDRIVFLHTGGHPGLLA